MNRRLNERMEMAKMTLERVRENEKYLREMIKIRSNELIQIIDERKYQEHQVRLLEIEFEKLGTGEET